MSTPKPTDKLDKSLTSSPEWERYSRQMLFEPVGLEGQRRLADARVTLIGCGGLGTPLAGLLARAGVGFLRIVDRDFLELNNLQRQILFDEDDVAACLPKAEAARRKLTRINTEIAIEAVVADADHRNIESLCEKADLILDGTDNFETRFLINDVAVKTGTPWIYGAAAAATGLMMPVIPGNTPCLQCVFEQAPPPELNPTCDTVGILGPVVSLVAALQAVEAIKILTRQLEAVTRKLVTIDAWAGRFRHVDVARARNPECPCCGAGRFDYLEGKFASTADSLCGRNAVQIRPPDGRRIEFGALAEKLRGVAAEEPRFNAFMLRATIDSYELTIFTDGRAIIKGVDKPDEARAFYAKYIGT